MALFLGFRAEARKRVPGTGSARGLCADLPAGLCWRLDALLGMAFPLVRRGEFWGIVSFFFLISEYFFTSL